MSKLFVKKLNENALLPIRGSEHSAGYDLFTNDDYELKPGERHLYKTNLSFAIPSGRYGRIAPRSGLSLKKGIDVMAGVIDEDYRGDVGILLINLSNETWKPEPGKAIAQIIFEYYEVVSINQVEELPSTNRGSGGFGSTDASPNKNLSEIYTKLGGVTVNKPYGEQMKEVMSKME